LGQRPAHTDLELARAEANRKDAMASAGFYNDDGTVAFNPFF
jgi:hypothetical protein